jgi:phospholipid/cholesterol/gamma-HCH transport system substrate-binding protein
MNTREPEETPDEGLDAMLEHGDEAATQAPAVGAGSQSLRRPLVLGVAGVVVLALVVVGLVVALSGPGNYRVSAMFPEAPGVYPGNAVKVLGVRVGKVESITPSVDGVKVVMSVQETTRLPAGVKAYLMAPNVVNDRFIELDPGYTGGSTLPAGTTLPIDRAVVPQSVDQIVASIDRLATDLGPSGANEDGSLSRLLRSIAQTLGGSGDSVNASVKNLGKVFAAVSDHTDDVTSLLNDLGGVTHAAAGVSGKYQQLAGDLAKVSSTLADNDVAIAGSVKNLARVLDALNTFVKDNKSQLKGTLGSMSKIAGAVGRQQKALSKSMRLLPLAVDNAGRTVTKGGVRTRFDQVTGSKLHGQICGDGVLRLLLLSLSPQRDHDKTMDLACGTNELLLGLRAGPGSPSAVLLTRDALLGLGGH